MSRIELSRRDFLRLSGMASIGAMLARTGLPLLAQSDLAGTINYIHHFTSETEFEGLERVMDLFQARYPDISVVQEVIPNADYMARFAAAVVSNSRPDTAMVTATRVRDMLAMDGLVDLTERVNNWDLKSLFPENRWEGVTVDGRIYGVPSFAFIDWMYYRKDWFEEAGIEPPTTFEEFREAAIALTDSANGRYGFGMRAGDGGHNWIWPVLQSFNGGPFVVDGEMNIDREAFTEAVKWYTDLALVDQVVPPSAASDSYRQVMDGFKTGQTAMVWHHTGSLAEISEALEPEQFGTLMFPAGPNEHVAYVTYANNSIMKEDNVEEAWAWITFWAESEPGMAFLEETGYFPASVAIAGEPAVADNELYQAAFATLEIGQPQPAFIGANNWGNQVVLPELQKVLTGQASAEEAADAMIAGLEAELE